LYVCATNFIDGRQHIFHEGPMLDPIIASCSIPVLFSPVMINGIPYVDGGLSNNLPVEPFIQQKNKIVSIVDLFLVLISHNVIKIFWNFSSIFLDHAQVYYHQYCHLGFVRFC
jgi:predicted acylesterase/phospholipase RssA